MRRHTSGIWTRRLLFMGVVLILAGCNGEEPVEPEPVVREPIEISLTTPRGAALAFKSAVAAADAGAVEKVLSSGKRKEIRGQKGVGTNTFAGR